MKLILKYAAAVVTVIALWSCIQKQSYRSPAGFDFSKPTRYDMPPDLLEISGIVFNGSNSDVIYTESDETGRVYYLHPGDKAAKSTEFKATGDFEDIAITNNQVIMLQSKGVLFTLPFSAIGKPQAEANKSSGLLPEGEYEGMYADAAGQVYVLCKHCTIDKTSKQCSGFIFKSAADGSLKSTGTFSINVKHIERMLGVDKINFHPSAITRSPFSNDWYILSSVNKILVVADSNWKIRDVIKLDPGLFTQPEGITFDATNNLYISNEGHIPQPGNILKFPYRKP